MAPNLNTGVKRLLLLTYKGNARVTNQIQIAVPCADEISLSWSGQPPVASLSGIRTLVQITFLKRNKPPRLLFGKRPPQKQRRVSWKRTVSPKSYPRSYPQCPSHAPLTASENATYRASRDRSIGDTSDVWLGGCGNRRNGSKFSELTTGPAPFYNPRVGARSHHALSLPPQGTQQCKFVPPSFSPPPYPFLAGPTSQVPRASQRANLCLRSFSTLQFLP